MHALDSGLLECPTCHQRLELEPFGVSLLDHVKPAHLGIVFCSDDNDFQFAQLRDKLAVKCLELIHKKYADMNAEVAREPADVLLRFIFSLGGISDVVDRVYYYIEADTDPNLEDAKSDIAWVSDPATLRSLYEKMYVIADEPSRFVMREQYALLP